MRLILLATGIGILAFSIYTLYRKKTETVNQQPEFLYKVVTPQILLESADKQTLLLSAFDKNFIHFATQEQLPKIIQKFFPDQSVHILKIKVSQLPGRLVLEKNPGGETRYYHLYEGSIPKEAIVEEVKN